MLLLYLISVSCLLVAIQQGDTAVVDISEEVTDAAATDEDFQLSELQEKLKTIEETQTFILSKMNSLLTNEQEKSSDQTRIRRETNVNPQTQETSQECIPGTPGCPVSVTPYAVAGSCVLCPPGHRGYPGPSGPPGRDGRDGRDSVAVVTTSENPANSHQPCGPGYGATPSNTSGSVYVRWGHSECPVYSTLIYSGSVAGGHYGGSGNGVNQLCLPEDPAYDNPVAGVGGSRAFLYSIEYQISNFPTLESRNWLDVSCAVCQAPSRFGHLMIPGKQTCPSAEWTLEYRGYLMAERSHSSHKRSTYICVDREMQSLERTHGANSARGLLDLVEGRCSTSVGGLPCGPYIDGYEITCAVCTQ